MKRKAVMLGAAIVSGLSVMAQKAPIDTTQVVMLQEVEVTSTRATAKTPVAHTNVRKADIERANTGVDIPFLLTTTPSVLVTSDAGAGIGYTGIRVRGTDATRINITANGIPMNDAESHSIFWVNTPDLASSLEDMQVQRGAGTSTNGAGAFGASINMRTQATSVNPYAEVSGTYGSYNTQRETVRVGSGLIDNRWAVEARLSNIASDGYRDRAWADMQSYFLQAGWYGDATSLKFITFGGKELTYHAWDGISRDELKTDRRNNPNGYMGKDADGRKLYYDNQVDNYRQVHYHLLLDHRISSLWNLNLGLHYTDGKGYYEEYKRGRWLPEYGITPWQHDGKTVETSDLVRRKLVDSSFGGGVFSLNYRNDGLSVGLGGGMNYYVNDHNGRVMWVKENVGPLQPGQEYYRNRSRKGDANIYARAQWDVNRVLSVYGDLQLRHLRYKIAGVNDKWNSAATPAGQQQLAIDEPFTFFNPKAGVHLTLDARNALYASVAVAQKEPTRNNYTDGSLTVMPKSEQMTDFELGYTHRGRVFSAGINLYYMHYRDQLVLNGKLNEIGEAMAENVDKSHRMGVELTAGVQLHRTLRWDVNATLSRSRINDYTAYYSDFEIDAEGEWIDLGSQTAVQMGDRDIAFSPRLIAGSLFTFNAKGWEATFQTQAVSRQYLDNTQQRENSIDAFTVSNLMVGYTLKLPLVKSLRLGCTVYNIFNEKYETNGYSQTATIYEGGDKNKPAVIAHDPRFYPMAGTNVAVSATLKF